MTATWRKSSHSGTGGSQSDCVELAEAQPGVIRDSKNPDTAALHFTRDDLAVFFSKIKAGHLDRKPSH
jgi:hypothetical protein